MKAYKRMRDWENLSWCAPFRNGNTYYTKNEGEITAIMQDGKNLDVNKDTLRIVSEFDEWEELGCAECPWRDECDAMDDDVENWDNDELADYLKENYSDDDWDAEEAWNELCARSGDKLREMAQSGEDCSEIYEDLRRSVPNSESWFEGTPDYDEDGNDLIEWLHDGAEQSVRFPYVGYVIERILDVSLGI